MLGSSLNAMPCVKRAAGAAPAPAEVVGVVLVVVVRHDGVEAGHEDQQDGHLR
jgi:hypothetical protein